MAKGRMVLCLTAAMWLVGTGCLHRCTKGAGVSPHAPSARTEITPLGPLADAGPCVVLVPFPGCDMGLLSTVGGKLKEELAIPVQLRSLAWTEDAASRDQRAKMIAGMRAQLLAHADDPRVVAARKALNSVREHLGDEDHVVAVMKHVLASADPDAAAKLDASLLAAAGQYPQWDADAWLDRFDAAIKPFRNPRAAYIGVTPRDIYAKDFNYLFGWSCSRGAVVSYCRFADASRGGADEALVVSRLLKQCLSSVGRIYNIPRCADPSCARAYPNSLSEHDAKGTTLCPQCRRQLSEKFASYAQKP